MTKKMNKKVSENVKSAKAVSREIRQKAHTWKAVAAAINTIETLADKEAWRSLCLLGIHAQQGKVTALDLQTAWSSALKEPENANGYRYPQIAKAVPCVVKINGKSYVAYSRKKGEDYKAIKKSVLCRVCKPEEVRKGGTDVIVSVESVCKGLEQSLQYEETLAKVERSESEWLCVEKCFVNVGTKNSPKWKKAAKNAKLEWELV